MSLAFVPVVPTPAMKDAAAKLFKPYSIDMAHHCWSVMIEAATSQSPWRTIETAPRVEGVPFLILRRGIVVQVSWFEGNLYPDARECCIDWGDRIEDATHWMPRTEPPSS